MRPASKKTKFGMKATKNEKSSCGFDEEVDLRTILIGTFPISFKMFYYFSNFTIFFSSQKRWRKA